MGSTKPHRSTEMSEVNEVPLSLNPNLRKFYSLVLELWSSVPTAAIFA
ncbi:hypothetical protein M758_2G225700 [Ceratodon purpureus]|nr:hypothetical protein M758_2G225700 [Ceratodon purpureus]